MTKELLEARNRSKAKKPNFVQHDAHKKKRLGKKWRKPKGLQNKVRLSHKGYVRLVRVGFGSPALVKGLTRQGFEPVLVSNLSQLESLDKKKQAVIFSAGLGSKKKAQLIEKAKELSLTVLNVKDLDVALNSIKDAVVSRKEVSQKKTEVKDKRVKESLKKTEKAESKAKSGSESSDDAKEAKASKKKDDVVAEPAQDKAEEKKAPAKKASVKKETKE